MEQLASADGEMPMLGVLSGALLPTIHPTVPVLVQYKPHALSRQISKVGLGTRPSFALNQPTLVPE